MWKTQIDMVLSAQILRLLKLKMRIVRIAIGVLFREDRNANEHLNSSKNYTHIHTERQTYRTQSVAVGKMLQIVST